MIHHADDWLTIHGGDARDVLPTLLDESVDCIVTSPPYWGLRDYGTATWIGGDAECDHLTGPLISSSSTLAGYTSENVQVRTQGIPFKGVCGRCGASRVDSQLGLEATPEEYVANLVGVFRELRRVLKRSGTCWLNLGDSYGSGQRTTQIANSFGGERDDRRDLPVERGKSGFAKQLVGIPWRVAFALQADGWWLRSDIIWAKPNPMPESVTDRPTKAHEYLFLLTKAERYYFDQEAVREAQVKAEGSVSVRSFAYDANTSDPKGGGYRGDGGLAGRVNNGSRNLRSVWTIATRPYPGAHFAVFPPELPERCIKAGCPEGGVTLDPFAGSGTVGLVANRLSRRAILIDLNPAYLEQQMKRNAQIPVGL